MLIYCIKNSYRNANKRHTNSDNLRTNFEITANIYSIRSDFVVLKIVFLDIAVKAQHN